jgi:hypothetical protein
MKLDFGLRRIQVISGSAFVSLPRIWIKMCNLRKGDGVGIVLREDGVLEVLPIKDGDGI